MELQNMGFPLNNLQILSTNLLSELYSLVMKLLLANGAIEKLPLKVPACYAHPGLTAQLCMEKLQYVSGPVSQFLQDSEDFFLVDHRMAGTVTTILQQKPDLVISTEDARHTIKRKEDQQSGATRQPDLLADQSNSRVFWNSNTLHGTKNRLYENSEDKTASEHLPAGEVTKMMITLIILFPLASTLVVQLDMELVNQGRSLVTQTQTYLLPRKIISRRVGE
jgi:hypothetical protein